MYTNLYRSDPIQSTKKKKESKLKFPRNTKVSILSPEEHEAKKLYWKQSKQLLKNRKKMAEEDKLSRNFENLMKEIYLKEVKLDELKIASPAMIFMSPPGRSSVGKVCGSTGENVGLEDFKPLRPKRLVRAQKDLENKFRSHKAPNKLIPVVTEADNLFFCSC